MNLADHGGHSFLEVPAAESRRWGLRLVCLSDTHGKHRSLEVPQGDVLVHAGDFTAYGKKDHALDFNTWLGEQPHRVKVVVMGNHENNAEWHKQASDILTNAVFLRQSGYEMEGGLQFFGTDFFWPCPSGNPYFEQIPDSADIIIAHGPASGCVDGGSGCISLLAAVRRVKPLLVVSGHVHFAHGGAELQHGAGRTVLINAANCGSGKNERSIAHTPIVVDI